MPQGWRELKFGELCERIVNGGTPATDSPLYWGGKIPWVTGADFTPNGIGGIRRFVTELGIRSSATSVVKAGNLLVVTRTGVGKLAVAPFDIAISQDVTGVYLKAGVVDTRFTYYLLAREIEELKKLNQGTSINGIVRSDLERHIVRIPGSTDDQRRIAAVLASIDEAIEATEALIEKHQQIKAGLMHDLFTRGMLPSGDLRPTRDTAPDSYVDSPLGFIPREWSVTTCEAVCERVIDCKNRTPPETHEGYPVIRTPNVRAGEFVDEDLAFTDANSYAIWTARGKPLVGDIVITREAPVGEVCVIPERHSHACLGQRMMLYRPNPEKIDSAFLLFALQSRAIQNRLDLISGGSTVGHVRVGDIRTLWMYFPESIAEQRRMAETLSAASEQLRAERDVLSKLRQKKIGLMQDLLTGKVPVKLRDPAPEPVIA
jgi:type I restriction enzyme, S subunit